MREKPIIFSTEMVRAILDGRKSQTRRVIKPQPEYKVPEWMTGSQNKGWVYKDTCLYCEETKTRLPIADCAPYTIGDVLWVRETWAAADTGHERPEYIYKAWPEFIGLNEFAWTWKPSIHMPREAARLFLRVKGVRAERAQDITEGDTIAEGMPNDRAREQFMGLWNGLNYKRGYGWDVNPWVWAIEFERIDIARHRFNEMIDSAISFGEQIARYKNNGGDKC